MYTVGYGLKFLLIDECQVSWVSCFDNWVRDKFISGKSKTRNAVDGMRRGKTLKAVEMIRKLCK